ncbi:type ISP restriction/modification enzyme [Flavobacterium sp.]|uniref:type ISP restriction/modification enzyme n=1 Tax=Flavobacterium sp. TaxID=239 RepID=UPI002618F77C|nr:type ISP restriction/modification enzyme [Flavobacterium sp.]
MTLHQYIETINQRFRLGNATEHTFRGDLQHLLESLVTDIRATNEPKRQSCGAPDYIITRGDIPVGFIEAKDVGDKDLEGKKKTGNQEQFDRYKTGLANLIITDYIDFHFYRDGIFTTKISIGKVENGSIVPQPENYDQFTQLFKNFCETISQSIKSPTRLAEMMAGKARLMADIIEKSLNEDDENENLSNLKRQMLSFQKMLISDIDNKSFSDLYSQTIAYGMFAARYHDPTLQNFSREEAVKLIPKSNPFLRKLFKDIADEDLDTRLVWIIDELVNVFLASDVATIMKNFGKSTKQEDPVVHFYETFLGAYNPALRKARGVWYTPQPVVNFIVRAVDDILKTEFDLPEGLADSSKKKIKVNYQGKQIEKEVHKVQILDPATGTGTFLAETIKHIHKKYEGMQGIWSKYVEDDLIPRVNGFELLMASYAMAHLKLDMLLTETGYVPTKDQRLRVFLTNSLEEPHPDSGTLWGNLLSDEADQANEVKRDTPVMCIIGNPPYSGESANKGEWIMKLMEDYKKEPGGVQKLQERNPKWINDDYVKFLRYGQHYIEKNGQGVLAFINPHGFLDNPTFRGMRWNLLKTYDKIYTIDLHGNSKKKETAPDGSPDVNVFDIMQGVSINLFVKTGKKKPSELGKVFHFDLYGKREFKYNLLTENTIGSIKYKELPNVSPNFFFVNKDFEAQNQYSKGFLISDLFSINNVGIATAKDAILINYKKDDLISNVENFYSIEADKSLIKSISYRLFDDRYIYYDMKIVERAREKIMYNFLKGENLGLSLCKQFKTGDNYFHAFISNKIIESSYVSNRTSEITSTFPLYKYPDKNGQQTIDISSERTPNLNTDIVKEISGKIGLTFTTEKEMTKDTFAPIDILDYIYAVLHCPTYREKYKEFLKIDFPRVPYPKNKDTFWKLVKLGGEIRQIHLLESAVVDKPISKYPHTGTNVVGKTKYENSNVYINETQCFEDVPEVAWNFYIGGYQPAQKWLKDRKDRELQIDDIRHYMKIIVALTETDRLMKEIDKIEIE